MSKGASSKHDRATHEPSPPVSAVPVGIPSAFIRNRATEEGRELGGHLARFCDTEAARQGRDGRCSTCAFRQGDHLANGSPETLMTALKCALEREPFWCHESDVPCRGWLLMRSEANGDFAAPWDAVDGFDDPAAVLGEDASNQLLGLHDEKGEGG